MPYPTLPYPTLANPTIAYPTLPYPYASSLSPLATRRCTLSGEWDLSYCIPSQEFTDTLNMVSIYNSLLCDIILILLD